MRQLEAFVVLSRQDEMKKAAILYQEIKQSIEHFDPRFYLPSLFGPFYAQLARQGQPLLEQVKPPSDFETETLTALCRVDLELFLSTPLKD